MESLEHMSAALMMASFYPALVVIAVLMPSLPVLAIVEMYFLITFLYLSASTYMVGRSLGSRRLIAYSGLMILVLAISELAIWIAKPSETTGLSVLLSKAVIYLLTGSSLILMSSLLRISRLKIRGLVVVVGSGLVVIPYPVPAIIGLILMFLGCWSSSRLITTTRGDAREEE
ncbi:MAG: hypothetical protein QI197_08150 [Candidatus Korarchaeota archaeon]|nr:hypothetical protein [Candidatus Korarchaeota archaeon]